MGLGSLAAWCARRRWWVLVAWVVLLGGALTLAQTVGSAFSSTYDLPPGQGRDAYELLKAKFPNASGDQAQIVFQSTSGIDDPAVQSTVEQLLETVKRVPSVSGVQSPYTGGVQAVAPDRKIAFATVQFNVPGNEVELTNAQAVVDAVKKVSQPGLTIAIGGPGVEKANRPVPPASEAIGLLFAAFILLVAFGSVVAMGVPIVTALFGLGIGLSGLTLMTRIIDVPEFAPQLAAMIGLGVGIDYALFIVTRYRQELARGYEPVAAIRLSLSTAGRAVVFAGCTVIISLLGMFLMGVDFLRGLALGAVFAVVMVMVASVTLLPAVLGFAGTRINRLRLPWLGKSDAESQATFWYRWSRQVQHRPWVAASAGLAILVALSIPVFSIELGNSDAGSLPKGSQARVAYDLLSKGFGPGYNGPLLVAAAVNDDAQLASLETLRVKLQSEPGVAFVGPVFPSPSGGAAIMQVLPTTSPQDRATSDLVHRLRDDVIPNAMQGTGVTVSVGGFTAIGIDFSEYLAARLPLFIGAVLGLSFLLLLLVFRSILVPLKAVIMNVLSISASYGLVVAVFQWGWLAHWIGVDRNGPIEVFVPMLLFAILFGLSMDYEVFLLSRVREEYNKTGNNAEAVADGLASTARVITAAAAIMIAVFLSFVLGDSRVIKLFGIGLASAVLIDATLVRLLLVPATMELLGNANWWLPKWLHWMPNLDVEGADVGDLDVEEYLETHHGEPVR
jgi:RND superfamily putative drug exporter